MSKLNVYDVLRVVNNVLETPVDEEHPVIEKETPPLSEDQIETDFSEHEIDSITFIRIIVALESEFELEIPDEYLLMSKMNIEIASSDFPMSQHGSIKTLFLLQKEKPLPV